MPRIPQLINRRGLWVPPLDTPMRGFTGLTLSPTGTLSSGSVTDLGTWDIREYLKTANLSADQEYVVPNGTYTAGTLSSGAARASTGGRFGGAVVLKPQTPYGATIDMSPPGTSLSGGLTANGDLRLNGTTNRIILVGFNFRNGTFRPSGNTTATGPNARLWFCDLQFPATAWAAEPGHTDHTGGTYNQYHIAPRTMDLRGAVSGEYPSSFECFGTNFSNVGTAFFPGFSSSGYHARFDGCDFSNLDDGGSSLDPLDINHPDAFAGVGGAVTAIFNDCYIHPGRGSNDVTGIIIQDVFGNATLNCTNVWITTASLGINLQGSTSGRTINGTFVNTYVWDNYPTTDVDPAWDYIKNATGGSTISMTETGLHLHAANAPSGTDPATAWRAVSGHGYSDYETYLGSVGWV